MVSKIVTDRTLSPLSPEVPESRKQHCTGLSWREAHRGS